MLLQTRRSSLTWQSFLTVLICLRESIAITMAMVVTVSMVDMVEQATVQAMDSMETMAIMVTMLTATMVISTMTL